MPPRQISRFALSAVVPSNRNSEQLVLTERVRYGYVAHTDNIAHTVVEGDTLFTIAAKYFAPLPRPAGLFWILADFQPNPIHDPTIALTPGSVMVIPSLRVVQTEIFSEARREV